MTLEQLPERNAQLAAALEDAQEHLDWIGWGDSYEREAAHEAGLPEKIRKALETLE